MSHGAVHATVQRTGMVNEVCFLENVWRQSARTLHRHMVRRAFWRRLPLELCDAIADCARPDLVGLVVDARTVSPGCYVLESVDRRTRY